MLLICGILQNVVAFLILLFVSLSIANSLPINLCVFFCYRVLIEFLELSLFADIGTFEFSTIHRVVSDCVGWQTDYPFVLCRGPHVPEFCIHYRAFVRSTMLEDLIKTFAGSANHTQCTICFAASLF